MKHVNKLLVTSFTFVVAFTTSAYCVVEDSTKNAVNQDAAQQDIGTQPLKASGIGALAAVIKQDEFIARQMVKASNNVVKILKALEKFATLPAAKQKQLESRVVAKLSKMLITPVQAFFGTLRDFEWMFGGVVEEAISRVGRDYKESFFYGFIHADKSKTKTYFEDNIKSTDKLAFVAEELGVFFIAIEVTFFDVFAGVRQDLQAEEAEKAAAKQAAIDQIKK